MNHTGFRLVVSEVLFPVKRHTEATSGMSETVDQQIGVDDDWRTAVDEGWLLVTSSLVFFMQGGFMMLEIGTVRKKSARSVLVKNILDAAISSIGWFFFGYPIAYLGFSEVRWAHYDNSHWPRFIFNWAFVVHNLCDNYIRPGL